MTRLLFCLNDSPMRGSFWQKNNLITHILFELQPIVIFSTVANFGDPSLKTYSNSKWNLASIPCYIMYEVHGALKEGHEAR